MTGRLLIVLVLVNLMLLGGLAGSLLGPAPAEAQFGGQARYMMVAGEASRGGPQDAIYLIDMSSSRLILMKYDSRTGELDLRDGRVIEEDIEDFLEAW